MEVMQVNDTHLWKTGSTDSRSQEDPRLKVSFYRSPCDYQEERSRDEDLCEEHRNRELLQSHILQPGDTSEVDTVRRWSRRWRFHRDAFSCSPVSAEAAVVAPGVRG